MIYIDNGKTVKQYETDKRTEKAVMTLLELNEDMMFSETHEGYEVTIQEKKTPYEV